MKILVTGFDPFGGESVNPAWEAVKLLPEVIEDAKIYKLEIPTVFHRSAEILREKIQHVRPDMVLAVGQAGGRHAITPERVAINLDDARIPDNEANQPIDEKIQSDGANAYFSSLPVKAMVQAMKEVGIPAAVSNSAGTFVCNHIMYQLLYFVEKEFPEMTGGFVHVPFIPEQVADKPHVPSMNLTDINKGLEAGIRAMVIYRDKSDLKEVGGTIH